MNSEIKKIIFDLVEFNYDGEINYIDYDGVFAKFENNVATIGYCDKITLCRAFFEFAKEMSKNSGEFEIKLTKHFKDCGVMVDCSRNGVMTVKSAKKYIEYMAALGMNFLMLYTEDTYEIPEYPHFGYLRGRFTKEEIKEIDAYAQKFGIELVPCIQTLAHLFNFIKWKHPVEIRDTDDILLIDEPETYKFIEAAIKSIRDMFSSNRIHIGMDEAHNVGLGKFLDDNGYQDRFQIINRHLSKVIDICEKNGLKPMMWSDMFFRLASKTNNYYDDTNSIPQEILDTIPDVDMVYWDYYQTNQEKYDSQIKKHRMLKKPIVFAGGISVWYGHLPTFDYTINTSIPALRACSENNVDTVFATLWGDDGCECNIFLSAPLLPVFSEYFYHGKDCTLDQIKEASEFLTKQDFSTTKDMGSLDYREHEVVDYVNGKGFIYSDILYDMGVEKEKCPYLLENYTRLYNSMEEMINLNNKYKEKYTFAYYIYKICSMKIELRLNLQEKYLNNDKEYLKTLVDVELPELKNLYLNLKNLHRKMWLDTYKPFGFEVLSFRYGGIMSRIDDTIFTINSYLNGDIDTISELDEKRLASRNFKAAEVITPTHRL